MRGIGVVAALAAGGVMAVGCSGASVPAPGQAPAAAPAAVSSIVKPEVSINAVMVALVDHAGHELWEVERAGKAPKTDADWERIQEHAVQLVAAGPAITVGGTGVSDGVWVKSPDWTKHAQALSDAALTAVNASKAKNLEALVTANGEIVASCEGCHKQFKPELPTEGIVHTHAH